MGDTTNQGQIMGLKLQRRFKKGVDMLNDDSGTKFYNIQAWVVYKMGERERTRIRIIL